jgi:glycerate kinase
MLAARDAGATTLTIGIGGSASTDGGAGMLQVLGARLLDPSGEPIAPGHDALTDLATADLTPALQALEGIDLIAACDVTSPLLGPEGAAAVFGPQKGLRRSAIDEADARLRRLSDLLDPSGAQRDREGAGAAGGTGFGLMLLGAGFTSGADAVLDLLDLDAHLDGVDLVVTGEGHLDAQTLHGKGPAEVARRAHAAGIDVLAVAGALSLRPEDLASIGISRAASLVDRAGSTTQAIQRGRELLVEVGEELGRTL